MNLSNKKVAILVHDDFEQAEFEEPLQALKQAGAQVDIISATDSKQLQAMQHDEKGDTFEADKMLAEADIEEYDALVLPGGAVNADHLRMVPKAREWAKTMMDAGKPLAVICHAPWVLASAGIARGKHLTSYFTIQDDMKNAGADWRDEEVVIDHNLITSRQPDDLPAFCSTLVGMLQPARAM